MSYRAPVADMAFAMRHVAGLDRAIAEGLYGDLSLDLVETILEEAGKFASDVIAPLNRVGDRDGTPFKDGAVDDAAGLEGGLRAWTEAGWNALPDRSIWRAGAADAPQLGLRRDVERGPPGLRPRAAPDHGRHRGAGRARLGRPEGALSRQARLRRVDRDHEPDRAAGRLRSRRPAQPRRAGRRRHLPHHRPEDLHHLWRARPDRQHRPSRARAPARRAARHARHLALPRAEVAARRHAATTCAATRIEHKLGIHASPTCTMVYGDAWRRDRLARSARRTAASPACSR